MVLIQMDDWTDEPIHVDPVRGPRILRDDGTSRYYADTHPGGYEPGYKEIFYGDMGRKRLQRKHWPEMSVTEKEVLIAYIAKANHKIKQAFPYLE